MSQAYTIKNRVYILNSIQFFISLNSEDIDQATYKKV